MWSRTGRHRRHHQEDIVGASEQLLRGDAISLYDRYGQGAPAWAYLNVLAHADPERLSALAQPSDRPAKGPQWILAYLATEVLSAAHRHAEQIAWLQHAVLIPLELALLGDEVELPRTVPELAALVTGALGHGLYDADDPLGDSGDWSS